MGIRTLFMKYREPVLYILFGVATTVVNWIAYTVALLAFPLAVSNAIAWVVAVVFAFAVNKIYVFESRRTDFKGVLREASMFLGARIFTGVVEIAGLPLLVYIGLDQQVFGIEGAVAKAILSVVVVILNYIFSKFAIFRDKNKREPERDSSLRSE